MSWFKYLFQFLLIVFGYGFIINVMTYGLFQFRLDIFSVLGFGIAYYFLTEEVLIWFRPKRILKKGEVKKSRGEEIAEKTIADLNEKKEIIKKQLDKRLASLHKIKNGAN